MKKMISVLLVMLLICAAAAAETVYVTISDGQGNIAIANEAIDVQDTDADGLVTLHDALYAAHESCYPGGAEAGFATSLTDYGMSLDRLWGEENGGSYGYCVNNASAYNMLDPLTEGDSLYAYVYTDLEAWSDTFSFFDFSAIETGADFELTLSAQSFDADWNPVVLPVEGAEITLNGEAAGIFTDADGKAVLNLDAGEYLISAVSDNMTLVPPVCKAVIE